MGGKPIVIVGAGLSGLVAANALLRLGREVVVVERGPLVGGRLATASLVGLGGRTARLDHGAQFFTVRFPEFAELVRDWERVGLVREWCRGFGAGGDGFARYVVDGGMSELAKYLALTVDVRTNVVVHAVSGDEGVLAVIADGGRWESESVVLTAPIPQSLALCENGWLPIRELDLVQLANVDFVPCLALLVTLNGDPRVPWPGGIQLDADETWTFIGDNRAKGISDVPAVTFHATEEVSRALINSVRLGDTPDAMRTYLLGKARPWFGSAGLIESEVVRWEYARPRSAISDFCLVTEPIPGTLLAFIGDGFANAKVEGAARSGLAIARILGGQ